VAAPLLALVIERLSLILTTTDFRAPTCMSKNT
jgi:hypothetical protein